LEPPLVDDICDKIPDKQIRYSIPPADPQKGGSCAEVTFFQTRWVQREAWLEVSFGTYIKTGKPISVQAI